MALSQNGHRHGCYRRSLGCAISQPPYIKITVNACLHYAFFTDSLAAQGLPSASLAAQALRQGEVAEDNRCSAAGDVGAQFLRGQPEVVGLGSAEVAPSREPSTFSEAIANPRAARLDMVAIGDSTWNSLKDKTATIRGDGYTKECVVRCANAGSLMMKGHEPSPPALVELRHVL